MDGSWEAPVDAVSLGHVRQCPAALRASDGQRAVRNGQQAHNSIEQGTLARAVRAQDAHQCARTDLKCDAGQRQVPAALD